MLHRPPVTGPGTTPAEHASINGENVPSAELRNNLNVKRGNHNEQFLYALLDRELSILVAFATKIVK